MKYKFLFLMLALVATSFLPALAHDFHTSITDIKYNPRTQALEVSLKVFTDDLEDAVSKFSKSKITYNSKSAEQQKQIYAYLQTRLSFELTKGKPLTYTLLGSEAETDAVWMYVEVPVKNAKLAQLYVKNAVLTELFSDQMNVVNLNYKGKTESALLQRGEEQKRFSF
ncbi:hypothetical protein ABID22_001337 [Pontibacter aydingkolensis]|uniref:Uncharacterized protein n=1 Tax=Pontibacter aydingkolensis TaxID=1911536 RepID=A0ABS7CP04_9BACT|nr:DUF6702 family protein [Pontibacter aydingkolensis]MBW7465503.1 hypothetical protein [Pontibacter aydingkolensis]